MRKAIGPAYEKAPAELATRWVSENILKLIAGIVVAIVFCFVVNWLVGFFNFLEADGKDTIQDAYSTSSAAVDGIKVVGSIVLILLICRNRAK